MIISLNEFVRITVGWIYCLAPYNKPRFVEEIVGEVNNRFKENSQQIGNDFFFYEVDKKDVQKFVEDMLMPIKKFRELNLSKKEYEAGIDVDSDSRTGIAFVTAFSEIPEEDNFVDLDACIRNITNELLRNEILKELKVKSLRCEE